MILKYYHGYISIDKLSEMLNTNQNGTTAYNIKETLNCLGFKSYGLKSNNISKLKLPCIAHVIINSSYKHYIVIYKVNLKKEKILIADPSTTIKQISFKEFNQIWTGITIQMNPIRHIVYEQKPRIFNFISHYIKQNLWIVIFINILSVIFSIFSVLASLFFPIILSNINNKEATKIIIGFSLIFLIKNLILFLKNKLLIKLNLKLDKELQMDIFQNILNLPYRYYRRKTTGEITSYFNDLYVVRNVITELTQIVFIEIPLIIILFILVLKINIILLFILLALFLLFLLITIIYRKKQNMWVSEEVRNKSLINSYIVENIMGFETLKNLNIKEKICNIFKAKHNNLSSATKKMYKYSEKAEMLKNIINDFGLVIITIFIIKICNSDSQTFITAFILSSLLISSVKNIFNYSYQISELKVALNNLAELSQRKSENLKPVYAEGDITIKNLSYSFDSTKKALKKINLKIKKGTKVMVTGSSGSGKSTLFKIIKGYYKDYDGSVKIGDNEVSKYNFDGINYVSQKEILFTGTLEDNLYLKSKNQTNTKICEIQDFINDLNMLIEEDGFNLSGGQKQRIILARALNNFNILIIDEGLNQVSIDMERRILKNIFNVYQDKTIIYISHRLDNLDLFHHFIKINKGEIIINTKRNN